MALLVVVMIATVKAATQEHVPPAVKATSEPDIQISAEAWGVLDVFNNHLVFSKNSNEVLPIASVTKLVTAATLRDRFNTTATTTITWEDIATEGRAGSLMPGDELSLQTLIFPLLLESSNDAATTIENGLDEKNLVLAMNDYAASRDLLNTAFKDPSGLSPDNISTVRNLASLSHDIYFEQPHLIDVSGLPEYLYADYGWHNNSPFVKEPGYVGGKHGYTPEAGRTAIAFFDEYYPDGSRTVVAYILLNSNNLLEDVRTLRQIVSEHTIYE